jgi:uncharacterized membrane protein
MNSKNKQQKSIVILSYLTMVLLISTVIFSAQSQEIFGQQITTTANTATSILVNLGLVEIEKGDRGKISPKLTTLGKLLVTSNTLKSAAY